MDTDQLNPQTADRVIWFLIASVAAVVFVASIAGPFHIEWRSFAKAAIACAAFRIGSWFYLVIRHDSRLAAALMCTSQAVAFAAVVAPLSYIAAAASFPLWDARFMAWDQHLGFNWTTLIAFMNAHPALHAVLALAYCSFALQVTLIAMALAVTGRPHRLRVFILGFILTTLVTIAISTIMPAQGVWGYLRLSAIDYTAITPVTRDLPLTAFHGLRDGTLRQLLAEGAQGVISFPSLHAALAMLFIFALWPIVYLRWFGLALNALMIAATPIDGSHYLCDIIAGLAVAVACWFAASRLFAAMLPKVATLGDQVIVAPSLAPDFEQELLANDESRARSSPHPVSRTSVI